MSLDTNMQVAIQQDSAKNLAISFDKLGRAIAEEPDMPTEQVKRIGALLNALDDLLGGVHQVANIARDVISAP